MEIVAVIANNITRILTDKCPVCGNATIMDVSSEGLRKWGGGMFIQDAFPELSSPERENMLTGTHPACWDILFPVEEDDDYDPAYGDIRDECGASFVTGGTDPSGTECDQEQGHYPNTKHEGPGPFGPDGRVKWNGGGYCVGDPLPFRDVEFIN